MLSMLLQLWLMLFMLPQLLPTPPLPIMPQLLLLQLIMHLLRLMLMRFLPTPTPTLLLMTTQRPPSMLRRPLMVPAMSRDLTELLFLMAESKLLPTPPMDMMVMLLMSPMRALLPTQRLLQLLLMLPQLMLLQWLPMLPQLIMPQLLLTLLQLLLMLSMLLQLLPTQLPMLSMLLQWLLPMLSMPQLPTPQCLLLLPQLTMVPTSQSTDMAMVRSAINLSASHTRENTDPPPRARPLDPMPLLSLMPPTDFTEPRELLLMLSMPQLLPTLLPQLLFLVKPTNHLVDF